MNIFSDDYSPEATLALWEKMDAKERARFRGSLDDFAESRETEKNQKSGTPERVYEKIVVTGEELSFPAGALLGLDSRWQSKKAGWIEKLEEGVFRTTDPVIFPKGAVLWVHKQHMPKANKADPLPYRVSATLRGYREQSAASLANQLAAKARVEAPPIDRSQRIRGTGRDF